MVNTYQQRFLTFEERFWSKVQRTDDLTSCWTWLAFHDPDGYGKFSTGTRRAGTERSAAAHRVAYELLIGPVPADLVADHLCRNRWCVNPHHLEFVTIAENFLRGEGIQAINKRKTHCKRGHPLEGRYLQVVRRGKLIERHCRECKRLWMAQHRAEKRAAAI